MNKLPRSTESIKNNGPDDDKEKSGNRELLFLALGFSALALVNSQIDYGGGFGQYRSIEGFKDDSVAERVVDEIEDFLSDGDDTVYSVPDGNGGTVEFTINNDDVRPVGEVFSDTDSTPVPEEGAGTSFTANDIEYYESQSRGQ